MNFWQNLEQNWCLKCQNGSIIGDLTSDSITACSLRRSVNPTGQLRNLPKRCLNFLKLLVFYQFQLQNTQEAFK